MMDFTLAFDFCGGVRWSEFKLWSLWGKMNGFLICVLLNLLDLVGLQEELEHGPIKLGLQPEATHFGLFNMWNDGFRSRMVDSSCMSCMSWHPLAPLSSACFIRVRPSLQKGTGEARKALWDSVDAPDNPASDEDYVVNYMEVSVNGVTHGSYWKIL